MLLEPTYKQGSGRLAAAIMDNIRLPTFLVEEDATLIYSNAAGVMAIKEADCFKQASDTLFAVHPGDNVKLKMAIANASGRSERQTIIINDAHNPRPYLVTAIPFHDEEPPGKKGVIVFVQKCEPADDAFASTLRQLFRLSAAETAIAAGLVSGADIEHIAEARHAKITTVRTQIAAMLLKTRTRRQGELIALFSRICSLP